MTRVGRGAEDAGLVEEACGAVLRLAGSGELAEAIGRQGGVAAVVKGLRQHPRAPRLQATALLALLALSKSKHNQVRASASPVCSRSVRA